MSGANERQRVPALAPKALRVGGCGGAKPPAKR